MGLILGVVMAALIWLALWRTRMLSSAALRLAGAALLFGLGGYAVQGKIGLAGSPTSAQAAVPLPPVLAIDVAAEFYGRFNGAHSWLTIANSFMKRGDSGQAVATLQSGIRARPTDSELWIALGNALVIHGGGRMSPAAALAFRQSERIAPRGHPGPPFFLGLALLQQGQMEPALAIWRQVLAKAPQTANWREGLAFKIALVERFNADTIGSDRLEREER